MSEPRLTHKLTDALPETAWMVMFGGFKAKKKYSEIARDLAALGFQVSERSIARRAQEWRAEQHRRQVLGDMSAVGLLPRHQYEFQELVGVIENLDLGCGCLLRAVKTIRAAVKKFLRRPDAEGGRELENLLIRFQVQTLVLRRHGIDLRGDL